MEYAELERAISHISQYSRRGELSRQNTNEPNGNHHVDRDLAYDKELIAAEGHLVDRDLEAHNDLELDIDEKATHVGVVNNAETLPTNVKIVDWDGDDDPKNPMNWTMTQKYINCAIVSFITLVTPLASSMFAPAVPDVMAEFKSDSQTLSSFIVSVYLLGFAFGPLILAPLSELYGRKILYNASNVMFAAFTIGCGRSTSLGMLIAFRFLAGCVGCAPLTIGGGSIADMIPQEQRGKFMAIYGMGPLLGPVIGPICGGYLSQSVGWRWVFYVLAILIAFICIVTFIFLHETHAPTLLRRKTAKLNVENTDPSIPYQSKYHSLLSPKQLFLHSITRPLRMMASPIVFLLSAYMAVVYGYLYLLFTTFYIVFQDNYGFATGTVGLTYLGIGLGSLVGLVIIGVASDKLLIHLTAKNGGIKKPEYRLPPMTWSSWCVPTGLFIYGWSAQYKVFWLVPILGTGLVGVGLLGVFMPIQVYLVDTFTLYAASALAANTILRSVTAAFLPLAGVPLFDKLGVGWGCSLLGFIAVAIIPIPVLFNVYGERLRLRFHVSFD